MSISLKAVDNPNDLEQVGDLSTDECLAEMAKYGLPRVFKMDGGWHACIDVFVTGEGVSFEVRTSFKELSPNVAVNKCLQLLMKAIEDVKNHK